MRKMVLCVVASVGIGACGADEPQRPQGLGAYVVNEAGERVEAAIGTRCIGNPKTETGSCTDMVYPLKNTPSLRVGRGERLRILYGLRVDASGDGYADAFLGDGTLPPRHELPVRQVSDDATSYEVVLPKTGPKDKYLNLAATFNDGDTAGDASFQIQLAHDR